MARALVKLVLPVGMSPDEQIAEIKKHRKTQKSTMARQSVAPRNTGIEKKVAETLLISLKESLFRVGGVSR